MTYQPFSHILIYKLLILYGEEDKKRKIKGRRRREEEKKEREREIDK